MLKDKELARKYVHRCRQLVEDLELGLYGLPDEAIPEECDLIKFLRQAHQYLVTAQLEIGWLTKDK